MHPQTKLFAPLAKTRFAPRPRLSRLIDALATNDRSRLLCSLEKTFACSDVVGAIAISTCDLMGAPMSDRTYNSLQLGPAPGSRVLIAGGAGGIGRELTKACLALDLDVTVLDIKSAIEASTREDQVTYITFDGRDPASIRTAAAAYARDRDALDAFFFLSGFPIIPRCPLAEVPLEKWQELFSVNLTASYLLMNEITPLLKNAAAPAVVTVASSLAYQPMPGMGAYAASKGGLITLTKAFAAELAPHIRVNAVAPGAVDTEFLAGGVGRMNNPNDRAWFDAEKDRYISLIPLRRVAEPVDVVGPMLFLAGPASSYMTGQVLHLSGGRLTP